jgi:DNA polymerase III psi subunit
MKYLFLLLSMCLLTACSGRQQALSAVSGPAVVTGAEQTEAYLPLLKHKRVAIVANQTTTIGTTHLVDSLLRLHLHPSTVFVVTQVPENISPMGKTPKRDCR